MPAPLVFLMPGADGDMPALKRFRAAFGSKIRFVVIQYPTWREMIDAGADFDVIARAAEAQVRAFCRDNVCLLVGYSFGGFVAWETARRLVQSGWQIGFLGVIDSRRRDRLPRARRSLFVKMGRLIRSMVLRPRETLANASRRSVAFLVAIKAFWLLRPLGEIAVRRSSKRAFILHWNLIEQLRLKSLRRWELKPFPIPATLFRSGDFRGFHIGVVPRPGFETLG
jgi:thioesterase domain-containing protein